MIGLSSRPLVPGASRALVAAAVAAALVASSPAAGAQSLRGSRASVERMHDQAVAHGLRFYETSAGVRTAAARGGFERLTGNGDYRLKAVGFPYVTEQTRVFVERLARQYHAGCGEPLVVTSAIRPEERQPRNSVDLSVHPTGMAVDLRKPTKAKCLKLLRTTLLQLEAAGVLEATEERRPPHFHVAVFPEQYTRYVENSGGSVRLATLTTAAPAKRVAESGSSSTVSTYKVRPGDSLWTIARRQNVSVEVLRRANSLRSSRIVAGQLLTIPRGG